MSLLVTCIINDLPGVQTSNSMIKELKFRLPCLFSISCFMVSRNSFKGRYFAVGRLSVRFIKLAAFLNWPNITRLGHSLHEQFSHLSDLFDIRIYVFALDLLLNFHWKFFMTLNRYSSTVLTKYIWFNVRRKTGLRIVPLSLRFLVGLYIL